MAKIIKQLCFYSKRVKLINQARDKHGISFITVNFTLEVTTHLI